MSFELAPFDLPAEYGAGVVSLADAKAQINVLHSEQDALIGLLRDAAVDMVERFCGVYLAPRTGVVWRNDVLPAVVDLGVWPVTAITAIDYLDSDGLAATGTASDWRVVKRDRIALKPGKQLPVDVQAGVEITFSAGFTAANRPATLVQAVKMFTGHLFKNREAVLTGTISSEIPLGFQYLCGASRMPNI